jgi:RNA polymerase sigma-70 factor (ECF subfamily)
VSAARTFEQLVLPCLDSGYNLARWLLRDEAAAEDVVQEAALRAFRYLDSLQGHAARPWFLRIVRNTCYSWIEDRDTGRELTGWDDEQLERLQADAGHVAADPAELLSRSRERARIEIAIRALAPAYREMIVLREIEGLDYADIALVASIPIGTVMSRLSRARALLRRVLDQPVVGHGKLERRDGNG